MSHHQRPAPTGTVYLVGSGPGALDLMTVRATRLIGEADVVVHDHLVADGVLDLVRPDAQKICVGKKASNHTVPQDELNRLLVRLAREGKKVVRLKGGDPFIFGRGGEEIETLMAAGIPFQVVPGVTAAAGCAAYAGIPLTHRDYAQACVFVTGHLRDGTLELNWPALAQPRQTVVFYMGLKSVRHICDKLCEYGMAGDVPVALVEQGTTSQQRVYCATLATLSAALQNAGVRSPALLIVGEVVKLRSRLAWFEPSSL